MMTGKDVRTDGNEAREVPAEWTFAVLAECWYQPTEELVAGVSAGLLDPIAPELEPVDLSELRAEHSRLLIGPGDSQVPPYESVYRDGRGGDLGPVMGDTTQEVAEAYRSRGMAMDDAVSEMPDHIGAELEFVASLLETNHREGSIQFLDDHLRNWVGTFTERIEAETRLEFFEVLARRTREVVDEDL